MSSWQSVQNLLAIRMDNLGDVIMVGPALRAVKEQLPSVHLTLLASTGGALAAPLLPWIDDVIPWRAIWQDMGHLPFDPAREEELVRLLRERSFDGALNFTSFRQTPHAPGYTCYLAGIPLRAGESKEFGGRVLTDELAGAPDELHQVERNLRLVELLGFEVRSRQLAISVPEQAQLAGPGILAAAGLDPDRPYILLHPGASAQARRYPAACYGDVAQLLTERGYVVLITSVPKEAAMVEAILQKAPLARALSAQISLSEYAALVERAALVVCNNTLPMHLADALCTPTVVLFAGTEYEEQWRPRSTRSVLLRRQTPCQPCYLFECPIGQPCLDIAPGEVADICGALLEQSEQWSGSYPGPQTTLRMTQGI